MRIAIDTNRYRDLRDDIPDAIEIVQHASIVCIPFVVLAELRIGFGLGRRRHENETLLNRFLEQGGVEILHPDIGTNEIYVSLFLELKRRGKPIPLNDLWIGALCVQHQLTLYTRDKHFDALPQIARA